MSTILDAVTLEDWQDAKALSALTVVTQQLLNENPIVNKLAFPVINHSFCRKIMLGKIKINALIAQELAVVNNVKNA
jgi:hypothetical protein